MEKKLIQYFRIIIAIIFIFSAIAKLVSLAFFDGMVAELLLGKTYYNHPGSLYYIQLFTRGLISIELFLGAALLQTKRLKSFILPVIQLMLIVFTGHLFYVSIGYMSDGKNFTEAFLEGNCGCFGDIMPMSNFESICKNIFSMLLVGYLWLKVDNYNQRELRFHSFTAPLIIGFVTLGSLLLTVKSYNKTKEITEVIYKEDASVTTTLIDTSTTAKDTTEVTQPSTKEKTIKETTQPSIKTQKQEKPTTVVTPPIKETKKPEKKLSYSEVLDKYTKFSNNITTDLNKGEKLICMFSLSCGHCQEVYKEICELNASGKLPNTLLLVYGSEFELNYFFNQAGCKHPYIKIEDYNEFKVLLDGHDFPYVLARNNGTNKQTWDLEDKEIDEDIAKFYGIEKAKPKEINSPFGNQEEDSGMGW